LVGPGVGIVDGIELGDGVGRVDGLELGSGVGAPVSGQTIQVKVITLLTKLPPTLGSPV